MGLFGRKYDGSAIRNAEPTKPETLAFMNGPDLLGNPTSGQVYEDPRGPMNYNPGPTFKQRLGGFLEGTVNDLMHMRGIQNTALDQRRALEMYKRQQQDEIAQYERKQQIEAQYKTSNPTEFERLLRGSGLAPDEQLTLMQQYVRQRAAGDPIVQQNADGTRTLYPRSMLYGGAQAPQTGSVVDDPRGPRASGGAFNGDGFVPPLSLQSGQATSGRRTIEGNKAVGGVPDSRHLTGQAMDYWGKDLNAVLAEARNIPGIRKAFIHKGHVHTEGDGWNAPYYGRNGTKGR